MTDQPATTPAAVRTPGTPYRVPAILRPRATVWAVDCEQCGKQTRMGYHSARSAKRMVDTFGALCNECRHAPVPEHAMTDQPATTPAAATPEPEQETSDA